MIFVEILVLALVELLDPQLWDWGVLVVKVSCGMVFLDERFH